MVQFGKELFLKLKEHKLVRDMLSVCTIELMSDLMTMRDIDLKVKYRHIDSIIGLIYQKQVHARFVTQIGLQNLINGMWLMCFGFWGEDYSNQVRAGVAKIVEIARCDWYDEKRTMEGQRLQA